jgi:hypothetical protein
MEVADDGIPVEDLLTAVKVAVKQANMSASHAKRDLTVAALGLTLNTVATRTAGGGVTFRVPFIGMSMRIGGKVTRQNTHTINLSLVPEQLPLHEIRDGDVEETLVDALTMIQRVLTSAAAGDDPFRLDSGTVELKFAVTRNGAISLGVDGELTDDVTQTLRLEVRPTNRPTD